MNTATIRELLQEAESKLPNSDSARLDAEILLCNVLNVDRSKLYSAPGYIIPEKEVSLFKSLVKDRQHGKPVAYLTGIKEFWSLEFQVNEHTLVPRPETECLVESALQLIPENAKLDIVDLGTGSGAIAIAIASERPNCAITATDICDHVLGIAAANASRLAINNINFIKSDWYANLQNTFDIIVSNPPYIRNDDIHLQGDGVAYEPGTALRGGENGLDAIRCIIDNAIRHLNHQGWLLIEHGYDQAQAVNSMFEKSYFTDIHTFPDHAGIERVTCGKRQCE